MLRCTMVDMVVGVASTVVVVAADTPVVVDISDFVVVLETWCSAQASVECAVVVVVVVEQTVAPVVVAEPLAATAATCATAY